MSLPPVYQTLVADPATATLLGSDLPIYAAGRAPQGDGAVYPYVVWQIIGGTPENYLASSPDVDLWPVQIDLYSRDGDQAAAIMQGLADILAPHGYVISWRPPEKEPQALAYRAGFDFDWWNHR